MERFREAFHVIKKHVCNGKYPLKILPRYTPGSIYGSMDSGLMAFFQHFFQKVDLQHTLSAGEGHTATRGIIKQLIGFDLSKSFLHCVVFSAYFPGMDRAVLGAFSAQGTFPFPTTAYLFAHAAGNTLVSIE
jgi:hypothetical protein